MRIARLIVVGVVVLAATPAAEAGWFGSKEPRAISPLYQGRGWDSSHASHPLREYRYNRPGWGALWKQVYASRPNRAHPYIRGY